MLTLKENFLEMKNYYRTNDMLNLLYYFPKLSPITDLVIVEQESDFITYKNYLESFTNNRVDSLKGRGLITGIENAGKKEEFLETLKKVKEKDPLGVLVLFKLNTPASAKYQRYAGISLRIDVREKVYIEAVGKGFYGREVSKNISVHERYIIPWFELRKISIDNFKQYRTYLINDNEYKKSRQERIRFLESIGLPKREFESSIPKTYQEIPNFIWKSIIQNVLKELEKIETELLKDNFTHFAISGHTEEKEFKPWQMFDKNRWY